MVTLHKPLSDFSIAPDGPVATQVLSALRSTILFGEFKPGRRLSEQEIAKLMNVSRQPVREAFIRLGVEGLVEIRPQRGTFVSTISLREVHDSRFVRESVEADLSRLAAQNITPDTRATLEKILDQQKQSECLDALSFMGLDEALHKALAETAGKPRIWAYLQKLKSQLDRVRFLVAQDLPIEELISQHDCIVRAVVDGDSDKAEQATRTHLRQILTVLPKIAEIYPDYFETGE